MMTQGELEVAIAFARLELAEVEAGIRDIQHCPGIQGLAKEGEIRASNDESDQETP